jgi:hypothetical protein
VIKTNSEQINQSLRTIGDLATTAEGGSTPWLVAPPSGIASTHPSSSLSVAISSLEDPVSVVEHSMQGMLWYSVPPPFI